MRVLKFGGTSVGDANRIMGAARIAADSTRDDSIIVVVSATADTTDALVDIGRQAAAADHRWRTRWIRLAERHRRLARELSRDGTATSLERLLGGTRALLEEAAAHRGWSDADHDRLLATGERLTVPLMVMALMRHGLAAIAVDGRRVITTDCRFGGARIDHEATRTRARGTLDAVDHTSVVVVPGFVAASPDGRTTTLGRGGSDLTATTLGEALGADRVEIWTDVAGVLTAPPTVAPWARPIPWLTYDEADTLAWGGAKVLHPKTLEPAARACLRVDIRSSLEPVSEGTVITADSRRSTTQRGFAVAILEPAALVSVRGRRGRLTEVITLLELLDPAVDLAIDPVSARVQAVGPTSWVRQAWSVLSARGLAASLTDDMALVTIIDLDHQRLRLERVVAAARLADESPRGRMATAVGETGCRFLIARSRLRAVLEAIRIEAGGWFDRHHALRMAEAV